ISQKNPKIICFKRKLAGKTPVFTALFCGLQAGENKNHPPPPLFYPRFPPRLSRHCRRPRLRAFRADPVSFDPTGMPDYSPEHTDRCM
ncbi:hypothetical protein P2C93_21550, partial [Xanthomonas perforans]